jgi:hypothetical protein
MSLVSRLRQKRLQIRMALVCCAALGALALPVYFHQPTQAQKKVRARNEAGDMQCISYCSPTRPGIIVMEVQWRLATRSLNATTLRSVIQQQGLEVTVYNEGFERGLYATVSAIKPNAVFRTQSRNDNVAPANPQPPKIPGLDKLTITDIATRLDRPARSFLLDQPLTVNNAEWVTVRLEGLEPGMEYTYRVPGRQSVVTCQAARCPVDRVPR